MSPWLTIPLVVLVIALLFFRDYMLDRGRGKGYRWRNPKYVAMVVAITVVGLGVGFWLSAITHGFI